MCHSSPIVSNVRESEREECRLQLEAELISLEKKNLETGDQGNWNLESRDQGNWNLETGDQGNWNLESGDQGNWNLESGDQATGIWKVEIRPL